MSTILKALRRLEDDKSTEAASSQSLPPTDPGAASELRNRILAKEAAAHASENEFTDPPASSQRLLLFALVAVLLVGLGVGVYSTLSSEPEPPTSIVASTDVATRENPPPRPVPPVPIAAAAPIPATPPEDAREKMASAAVTPTPAVLAAQSLAPPTKTPSNAITPTDAPGGREKIAATRRAQAREERAAAARLKEAQSPLPDPTPARISELPPKPQPPPTIAKVVVEVPKTPVSTAAPITKSPAPSAEPLAETLAPIAPETASVKEHTSRGLPDITVVHTAWHPRPDRRFAKIRLLKTNETLSLNEGDAVGGLVIREISPSAVLFLSGEIEVRLRVGQPGSGG